MRRTRRTVLLAAALVAAVPCPARTQEAPGARDCATILLTSLGYVKEEDRTAEQRLGEGLSLLALHNGELSSRTLCNDVVAAVKDWGKSNKVGGTLPIRGAAARLYDSTEDLARLVRDGRYGVIFVSEGLRGSVEDIARVASDSKVLTTCASKDYVELGLAMGFAVEDRQLRIYVNRDAASNEGFQFRSALIRRATLIGEGARR